MEILKAIIKRSQFNILLHNYIYNIKVRNFIDILLFPLALIYFLYSSVCHSRYLSKCVRGAETQ